MLALGIILLLVAVGLLTAAVAGTTTVPVMFDLGVVEIEASPLSVFLAGAVTLLLAVIGASLVRTGVRQTNKRRKEKRELHRLSEKYETPDRRDLDRGRRRNDADDAAGDTRSTATRTEHRDGPADSSPADARGDEPRS